MLRPRCSWFASRKGVAEARARQLDQPWPLLLGAGLFTEQLFSEEGPQQAAGKTTGKSKAVLLRPELMATRQEKQPQSAARTSTANQARNLSQSPDLRQGQNRLKAPSKPAGLAGREPARPADT